MDEHDHTGKDEPATNPAHDEVAKKAYAIYLKEGRPEGHAEQNWLEAETQLQPVRSDHPAQQPKGKAWHSQSAEEVLAQLGSAATGLSAQEAAQRLAADGPNELKEGKRISPLPDFPRPVQEPHHLDSHRCRCHLRRAGRSGRRHRHPRHRRPQRRHRLLPGVQRGEVHRGAQEDDRAAGQGAARRAGHFDSCRRASSPVTSSRWKPATWSRRMPGSWRRPRSSASSPR